MFLSNIRLDVIEYLFNALLGRKNWYGGVLAGDMEELEVIIMLLVANIMCMCSSALGYLVIYILPTPITNVIWKFSSWICTNYL
jgi:hypothetical protein